MDLRHMDSKKFPMAKGGVRILGVEPTRRAIFPQNPIHDRVMSTLDNAIQTINMVKNVISLPIAKEVLSSIGGLLSIVKKVFANQSDFEELAEQCQMIGLVIWRATSAASENQLDSTIHCALVDLQRSVENIQDAVKLKAEKSLGSKIFHVTVNQDTIIKWRNDLNQFIALFNMKLNISAHLKLNELLSLFQELASINNVTLPMDFHAPSILPPSPRIFIGREHLVQRTIMPLLEFHHVALIGPGGIGKTSIAQAVLNNEVLISKF